MGWKCPSVSLCRLVRLGHEGVIGTWRAPGRRCAHDAGGMPVTSVTGRRHELVKPVREGGAIGELDRFRPRFPLKSAYVVENSRVKKRKFLRFMREAVQRRLLVEGPRLSTPPTPVTSAGRPGVPFLSGEPR